MTFKIVLITKNYILLQACYSLISSHNAGCGMWCGCIYTIIVIALVLCGIDFHEIYESRNTHKKNFLVAIDYHANKIRKNFF